MSCGLSTVGRRGVPAAWPVDVTSLDPAQALDRLRPIRSAIALGWSRAPRNRWWDRVRALAEHRGKDLPVAANNVDLRGAPPGWASRPATTAGRNGPARCSGGERHLARRQHPDRSVTLAITGLRQGRGPRTYSLGVRSGVPWVLLRSLGLRSPSCWLGTTPPLRGSEMTRVLPDWRAPDPRRAGRSSAWSGEVVRSRPPANGWCVGGGAFE